MAADVHKWVDGFLSALDRPRSSERGLVEVTPPEVLAALVQKARAAPRLVLLLDYDGTLAPFAAMPELGTPDEALLQLLRTLADRSATQVHVISGRTAETLERWLGALPITLHAEHGLMSRAIGPGAEWVPIRDVPTDWKDRLRPVLEEYLARTPGALLEEKVGALAWHYRLADRQFGPDQARALRLELAERFRTLPIEVITGSYVVEVRLPGVHKGQIAKRVLGETPDDAVVLAMGDDRTDEDLFAALPETALTVHVGPTRSQARYRVLDYAAARNLLRALID
jgi:trehalose 6-phosphate synthase/phosphatase